MPRPVINLPDWFVTDAGDRVEPDGAKKLQGYQPEEPFPAQHMNWLLYSISLWLEWVVQEMDRLLTFTAGPLSSGSTLLQNGEEVILTADDDGHVFLVDTATNGLPVVFRLENAADFKGMKFTIKDVGGTMSVENSIVDNSNGQGNIEGLADPYLLEADYGVWTFYSDGTDYWLI